MYEWRMFSEFGYSYKRGKVFGKKSINFLSFFIFIINNILSFLA